MELRTLTREELRLAYGRNYSRTEGSLTRAYVKPIDAVTREKIALKAAADDAAPDGAYAEAVGVDALVPLPFLQGAVGQQA